MASSCAVMREAFLGFCGPPCLLNGKKFKTRGFRVFELYMRVTIALVTVVLSPLILMYFCASPLLGSQEFTWAKVVSRRRWKEGERVRRGLYHRLVGPQVKQTFAYIHGLLLNILFFSVAIFLLSRIMCLVGARSECCTFGMAVAGSLIPSAILYVCAVAHNYVSRFLQYKEDCPLRYKIRMLWRSQEKTYDKLEDSVINMMFRSQIRDAMSITSMSRLDTQMLYGVPTAIVAFCCYLHDVYTGEEKRAADIREEASRHMGGMSVDRSIRLGFFRA